MIYNFIIIIIYALVWIFLRTVLVSFIVCYFIKINHNEATIIQRINYVED